MMQGSGPPTSSSGGAPPACRVRRSFLLVILSGRWQVVEGQRRALPDGLDRRRQPVRLPELPQHAEAPAFRRRPIVPPVFANWLRAYGT